MKLCDVDENGVSIGISRRDHPHDPGGTRGHRRHLAAAFPAARDGPPVCRAAIGCGVQVSSGAHPRYARNTGTDEPLGEATRLVAADMEIFHDPDRPSAMALPVWMG